MGYHDDHTTTASRSTGHAALIYTLPLNKLIKFGLQLLLLEHRTCYPFHHDLGAGCSISTGSGFGRNSWWELAIGRRLLGLSNRATWKMERGWIIHIIATHSCTANVPLRNVAVLCNVCWRWKGDTACALILVGGIVR